MSAAKTQNPNNKATNPIQGRRVKNLLSFSAIVTAGMLAVTAQASANSWDNLSGSGFNTSTPSSTVTDIDLTQSSAVGRGDLDIAASDTVNVNMQQVTDRFIAIDTENDPTYILGKLNSNGRLFILDENGVIFGEGSILNVGGIVASTGELMNEADVLAGGKVVLGNFAVDSSVVNHGMINVAEAGLAAFVAPTVVNNGVINAKMGKVVLASGETVTVDMYGDGLFEIAVEGELADTFIENTEKGVINADGGTVQMTASAAKGVVDTVINMDGVVSATSVTQKGGKIVLNGGGGKVEVAGRVEADGKTGGGEVVVKGNAVDVKESAVISADATENGDGGEVYLLGENLAILNGRVNARGGANGGNGGFVELSTDDVLSLAGAVVDTTAANGETGTFLIDPRDLELRIGTRGFDIFNLYESDIELLSWLTDIDLNARRNFSVSSSTYGSSDGVITVNNGNDLNIWTSNSPYYDSYWIGPFEIILANETNNSGSIDLTGNTQFGSDLVWRTNGDGNINILGAVDNTGVSNIVLSKLETQNGNVTISTQNGTVLTDDITTQGGDISVYGSKGIEVDGDVSSSGGQMDLFTASTVFSEMIKINAGASLVSGGGDINLDANGAIGGFVNVYGDIDTGTGDVNVNARQAKFLGNSTVTADTLNVTGSLAQQTANSVITANALTGSLASTASFGGTNNNIKSVGDFATGTAGWNTGGFTLVNNNGRLNIDGTVSTTGSDVSITNTGRLDVAGAGSVESNDGNIDLNATNNAWMYVKGNVDAGLGDIAFNAGSTIILTNGSTVNGAGVDFTGKTVSQEAGGVITTDMLKGDLSKAASFLGTANDIVTVGDFTTGTQAYNDGGFVLVDSNIVTVGGAVVSDGGKISITAPQRVAINASGSIDATGGDVDIISDDYAIGGSIDAGTLMFNRYTLGTVHLYATISQGEVNQLNVENLLIGSNNAAENMVQNIAVGNIDTTGAVSGLTQLNANSLVQFGFTAPTTQRFNAVEVNSHWLYAMGANVSTQIGDVTLNVANNRIGHLGITSDISSAADINVTGNNFHVLNASTVTAAGAIDVDTNTVVLDGDLDAASISGTATTVTVNSDDFVQNEQIQDGIDVAAAGATVNIGAGTYAEGNINIDKNLLISGAGKNQTIVDATGYANGFIIDTDLGNTNTTVRRLSVENATDAGLEVTRSGALKVLTLNQTAFNNNGNNGVAVYGTGVKETRILNSNFLDNGKNNSGNLGRGDVLFYDYNGDVTMKNVIIEGNTDSYDYGGWKGVAPRASYGVQVYGTATDPSGVISLENVNISGNYRAALLGIQKYNGADITLTDVVLGGQTTDGTDSAVTFGALYLSELFDTIDIGNTSFLSIADNTPTEAGQYIAVGVEEGSPDVDARNANFEGVIGKDATIAQSFAIEDKIEHDMDRNDTAFVGHVSWNDLGSFVTSNTLGIQNAIDKADDGATVNVDGSTYQEDLLIDKALKLTGHGTTLVSNGGPELIRVVADNVNIDPITFDGANTALFGVTAVSVDGLVVDGNTFQNFVETNVKLQDTTNANITGNTVIGGMNGVTISGGADNTVQLNTFTDQSGTGVYTYDAAQRSTIINNDITTTVSAPWGAGVYAWTGDNHVISGNTIDGMILGVGVDGSAKVSVSGNTISGAEEGVYASGASDIKIFNNTITGTTFSGISVYDTNGTGYAGGQNDADLWNNTITANGGTGIYVENSAYVTIGADDLNPFASGLTGGNKVSGADDGIVVVDSNNAQIIFSTITGVSGEGVLVDGGSNAIVSDNVINGTGDNGIKLVEVSGTSVQRNDIDDAGFNGIAAIDSDNVTIDDNNDVNGTFAAGVALNGTTNSTVDGNTFSNLGGSGVWAKDADNVTVTYNVIDGTWQNASRGTGAGVHVETTVGATVSNNTIDNTNNGGDGVEVNGSLGVKVTDNQIGTAGAGSIDAEGIDVNNSPATQITGNTVQNTGSNGISINPSPNSLIADNNVSFFGDDAAGIYVLGSNGTKVIGNSVYGGGFGQTGVLVEGSNNVLVGDDNVTTTTWTSVFMGCFPFVGCISFPVPTTSTDYNGNNVSNLETGIAVLGGSNNTIRNNDVTSIGENGIEVFDTVNGVFIEDNYVNGTGNFGIYAEAFENAEITGNRVRYTTSDGIAADGYNDEGTGFSVLVEGNDVENAGGEGIFVAYTDDVDVIDNEIDDVAYGGVVVEQSGNVTVSENDIDDAGYEGIYVGFSANALIDNNVVDDTENGIVVEKVHGKNFGSGVVSGGFATVSNNYVTDSSVDGISVLRSKGAVLSNNEVYGTGRDGISVKRSDEVAVLANDITEAGRDGVFVKLSDDILIQQNTIFGGNGGLFTTGATGAGRDGIHVVESNGVRIDDNSVKGGNGGFFAEGGIGAERDGIFVKDSDDVVISNNDVVSGDGSIFGAGGDAAGRHGIFVKDGSGSYVPTIFSAVVSSVRDGIKVLNNKVKGVGQDGIRIEGDAYSYYYGDGSRTVVRENIVSDAGRDGIYVNGLSNVRIVKNIVANVGQDGIDLSNSSGSRVAKNIVVLTGSNGIRLEFGDMNTIAQNLVMFAGDDGFDVANNYGLTVRKNTALFSGEDGFDIENSFGSLIAKNTALYSGDNGFELEYLQSARVRGNTAEGNEGYGILLRNSGDVRIVNNEIFENGNAGIRVEGEPVFDDFDYFDDFYFGDEVFSTEGPALSVKVDLVRRPYSYGPSNGIYVGFNTVDNNQNGIEFDQVVESTIEGNTITNSRDTGIQLENVDGIDVLGNDITDSALFGMSMLGGDNGYVVFGDNTVTFTTNDPLTDQVGALFESGEIDLTGDTNTFTGGDIGLYFDRFDGTADMSLVASPTDIPVTSGTFGTTTFVGQEDAYIVLDNNAFSLGTGSPILLDASYATFDGFTPNSKTRNGLGIPLLTEAEFAALEDMIIHFGDDPSLGLVLFGIVPSIDQEDIFRIVDGYAAQVGGLSVSINGLPFVPGANSGAFFNSLQPAAGGNGGNSPQQLANIEPAAGGTGDEGQGGQQQGAGEFSTCWSDALGGVETSGSATFNFGTSPASLLSGASGCQSGDI
ncbi:MAG: right-handed parallel beta-helix repeat-containing protein [Pseudomonadota bacterium]|nr:right-handed parallel beta-helix repeat-containing protein [Pseudomonadota bacterium]